MDKFTTSERVQQSVLQVSRQEMNRLTESLMHQHVTTAPAMRQTTQSTWKMGPDGCWYCEELGHFAKNCPHRDKHIRMGKIKISGNKMFFTLTGQPVPRGSNGKSAKMIVEEACNKENIAQRNLFVSPGEICTQALEPFLGTYEVVQFLELGNLKGTNPMVSWDANPIPYPSLSNTKSPHTIPFHLIPYHTIPCHTIPSFETCHRVSGVLFTKYKKYFCRLQY